VWVLKQKKKNKGSKPLSPSWKNHGREGGSQPGRDPDSQGEKVEGRERGMSKGEREGQRRWRWRHPSACASAAPPALADDHHSDRRREIARERRKRDRSGTTTVVTPHGQPLVYTAVVTPIRCWWETERDRVRLRVRVWNPNAPPPRPRPTMLEGGSGDHQNDTHSRRTGLERGLIQVYVGQQVRSKFSGP